MYVAYVYRLLRADGDLFLPPLPNPLALVEGVVHWFQTSDSFDLPDWPTRISLGGPMNFWVCARRCRSCSASCFGLAIHFLIFKPLRDAPILAKVVASVGLFLFLQAIVVRRFATNPQTLKPLPFVDKSQVDLGILKITQESSVRHDPRDRLRGRALAALPAHPLRSCDEGRGRERARRRGPRFQPGHARGRQLGARDHDHRPARHLRGLDPVERRSAVAAGADRAGLVGCARRRVPLVRVDHRRCVPARHAEAVDRLRERQPRLVSQGRGRSAVPGRRDAHPARRHRRRALPARQRAPGTGRRDARVGCRTRRRRRSGRCNIGRAGSDRRRCDRRAVLVHARLPGRPRQLADRHRHLPVGRRADRIRRADLARPDGVRRILCIRRVEDDQRARLAVPAADLRRRTRRARRGHGGGTAGAPRPRREPRDRHVRRRGRDLRRRVQERVGERPALRITSGLAGVGRPEQDRATGVSRDHRRRRDDSQPVHGDLLPDRRRRALLRRGQHSPVHHRPADARPPFQRTGCCGRRGERVGHEDARVRGLGVHRRHRWRRHRLPVRRRHPGALHVPDVARSSSPSLTSGASPASPAPSSAGRSCRAASCSRSSPTSSASPSEFTLLLGGLGLIVTAILNPDGQAGRGERGVRQAQTPVRETGRPDLRSRGRAPAGSRWCRR